MAASRTLKLTYLGDASNLSKSTKTAESDVSSLGERVGKVGKAIAVGFVAVGAAGLAMGKKLFDAFEQVSTANARIEAVITSMGNFGGQVEAVTERLVEQAEATARLTGTDRNLIKEAQALLLTFDSVNKTAGDAGGVFDRATQAAVDLAAAGFGSVTGNAVQLAKALEAPITGLASLGEAGVTFTDEQKEFIKTLVESGQQLQAQDIILQAIETQVGGVAEATANGSDKMRQAFGLLTEQVAEALAPAFEKLVEQGLIFVDKVAAWWDENGDAIVASFGRFRDRVKELGSAFGEFVDATVDELRESGALGRLRQSAENIGEAFGDTGSAFRDLLETFTGTSTQEKGSLFARYLDFYFVKPFGILEESLVKNLDLFERVLRAGQNLSNFMRGKGQLDQPGLLDLPDNFVPGQVVPGSAMGARGGQNVTVNVSGAIDPEGTARTITRTLEQSRLRVGRVSATQFTGGL